MLARTVRTAALLVVALVVSLFPGTAGAVYPGAGTDSFDSRAQVFITSVPNCAAGSPAAVAEVLSGPTTVMRGAPVTPPDERTEIPTEILSMSLTGPTVTIIQDPDRASLGLVKQQEAGEDFPAESFFDVFVEVTTDLAPGIVFENLSPVHMQSVIHSLPPHAFPYLPPPGTCVPLAVEGTSVPVLWLIHAEHSPDTNRLCAIGWAFGILKDVATDSVGPASFDAKIDVVYGTPSDRNAAEMVEMSLQGVWQGPRGWVNVGIDERGRTGSPGLMSGLPPRIDSFFDVFSIVSLDGVTSPGLAHLPMQGTIDPTPGAQSALRLLAPAPAGKIEIELLSLNLTSVNHCTTSYPPVDP